MQAQSQVRDVIDSEDFLTDYLGKRLWYFPWLYYAIILCRTPLQPLCRKRKSAATVLRISPHRLSADWLKQVVNTFLIPGLVVGCNQQWTSLHCRTKLLQIKLITIYPPLPTKYPRAISLLAISEKKLAIFFIFSPRSTTWGVLIKEIGRWTRDYEVQVETQQRSNYRIIVGRCVGRNVSSGKPRFYSQKINLNSSR